MCETCYSHPQCIDPPEAPFPLKYEDNVFCQRYVLLKYTNIITIHCIGMFNQLNHTFFLEVLLFDLWLFNPDLPWPDYQIRFLFKLQNRWNCHVTSVPIGERVKREEGGDRK